MKPLNRCLWMFSSGICVLPVMAANPMPLSALYALPDPTRPPSLNTPSNTPSVNAPFANTPTTVAAPVPDASVSSPAAVAAEAPKQLVLMRIDTKTGHSLAMIGNQTVSVGDRVGGSVVTAISITGVKLKNAQGSQNLSFWDASKQVSETPTAAHESSEKAQR